MHASSSPIRGYLAVCVDRNGYIDIVETIHGLTKVRGNGAFMLGPGERVGPAGASAIYARSLASPVDDDKGDIWYIRRRDSLLFSHRRRRGRPVHMFRPLTAAR